MLSTTAALVGIGLLLLAACGQSAQPIAAPAPTPTPVPTLNSAEGLIGVWHDTKRG
jgi:hypothetical protein